MSRAATAVTKKSTRSPREEIELRAWLSVVRAFYLCDALMARRLGAIGVKTAEHEILMNLRRDPGIAQQTLARRCFSAKSHISTLLTALEERGWVRREADPADARARCLYLTAAGERMAAKTALVQARIVETMAAAEPAKALAEVTAAMQRISDKLDLELAEATERA